MTVLMFQHVQMWKGVWTSVSGWAALSPSCHASIISSTQRWFENACMAGLTQVECNCVLQKQSVILDWAGVQHVSDIWQTHGRFKREFPGKWRSECGGVISFHVAYTNWSANTSEERQTECGAWERVQSLFAYRNGWTTRDTSYLNSSTTGL